MDEIMTANQVGVEITNLIMPFLSALVMLVVVLWFKDFAGKIAKGMAFKMDKAFNEGDKVLLDGVDSVIVKIGLTTTVFGLYGEKGYTWRYVPNERIPTLKLEKIINPHLHPDTDEERGRKLQALIEAVQDERITENKNAIEEIKNGK